MVRTPGFHPGNRGSIPRSATKRKSSMSASEWCFFFWFRFRAIERSSILTFIDSFCEVQAKQNIEEMSERKRGRRSAKVKIRQQKRSWSGSFKFILSVEQPTNDLFLSILKTPKCCPQEFRHHSIPVATHSLIDID